MKMGSTLPAIIGFVFFALLQLTYGQSIVHSPAPEPTSGVAGQEIDQGIAYLLLLVALAITYLMH